MHTRYRTRLPKGMMMTRIVDFDTRIESNGQTYVLLVVEKITKSKLFQPAKPATPKKPSKLTPSRVSCAIVRWMGVRWYGRPWLLRWRIWAGWPSYCPRDPRTGQVWPGCGCLVRVKVAMEAIGLAAVAIWRA